MKLLLFIVGIGIAVIAVGLIISLNWAKSVQTTAVLYTPTTTPVGLTITLARSSTPIPIELNMKATNVAVHTRTSQLMALLNTMPTIVPPDAENVPVYPGAKNIKTSKVWDTEWSHTSFEVYADPDENVLAFGEFSVLGFYDKYLKERGWTFVGESKMGTFVGRSYEWTDATGAVPWDIGLNVSIDMWTIGPNKGKVGGDLSLHRTPNLKHVPLYPNAQQIDSKEGCAGNFCTLTATYITSATLEEVEAYYRKVLPQLGLSAPSGDIEAGFEARYWNGTPEQMFIYIMVVSAKQEADGKTKVYIQLKH
jgi:hypothetical protein